MHHLETIHSTKNITLFFHLLSFICVENFRQKLQNVKYVMTNALILHYEKKKPTSPYEIWEFITVW